VVFGIWDFPTMSVQLTSEVDPKNWTTINVIKPGGKKPMGESRWHGSAWSRVRR
jgi:hypothetical protein